MAVVWSSEQKIDQKLAQNWPKIGPKLAQNWPKIGESIAPLHLHFHRPCRKVERDNDLYS